MAVSDNQEQVIDPRFYVPKGIVDMRQSDGTDYGYVYTPVTEAGSDAPIIDNPNATIPMPPTSFAVVDQHVRIAPDGSTVVDVTIEFPDVVGIESIDTRVTKAS